MACVDELRYSDAALRLLGRIKFSGAEITLLHVIERIWLQVPDPATAIPSQIMMSMVEQQNLSSQETLHHSKKLLESFGIKAEAKVADGFIANQIMRQADEMGMSLIALGSGGKGRLETVFAGSVSRKVVANAEQSVLVAREIDSRTEKIRAVFATDHSEYADMAIDKLIALAPMGLERLTIMTALSKSMRDTFAQMAPTSPDITPAVKDQLKKRNQELVKKVQHLSANTQEIVIEDEPREAIEQVMKEENGELLIVAAQGHGWLRRTMIGSVSYDAATTAPYSVLVLRPDS